MIIGLSTHTPDQARAAVASGADYIGVGPIYPTQTKKDVCAAVTLDYLDWVVANITLPFVAIGGIKRHNIADVIAHGARCCAIVSEFVSAPDIPARVVSLRGAMKNQCFLQAGGLGDPLAAVFAQRRTRRSAPPGSA